MLQWRGGGAIGTSSIQKACDSMLSLESFVLDLMTFLSATVTHPKLASTHEANPQSVWCVQFWHGARHVLLSIGVCKFWYSPSPQQQQHANICAAVCVLICMDVIRIWPLYIQNVSGKKFIS